VNTVPLWSTVRTGAAWAGVGETAIHTMAAKWQTQCSDFMASSFARNRALLARCAAPRRRPSPGTGGPRLAAGARSGIVVVSTQEGS
jgi:hypothetical protein